jgi:FlaA1/EpsC-like NDP-sugar epimerase
MTIPEACSLVLKAGGFGENGELYLLDMGESVRIRDLAEQMIRFYGFEPGQDIKIEYIGLRPGERLDELLWGPGERPLHTAVDRILRVERDKRDALDIDALETALRPICRFTPGEAARYRDAAALKRVLTGAIKSFRPDV